MSTRELTIALWMSALVLAVHTSSELHRLLWPLGWATPATTRFFAQLTQYELFSSHWKLKVTMGLCIAFTAGLRRPAKPKAVPIQITVRSLAIGLIIYVGSIAVLLSVWLVNVLSPVGTGVVYLLVMGTGLWYLIKGMQGLWSPIIARPVMDIDLPNPNLS